jgi:hypothetical protein
MVQRKQHRYFTVLVNLNPLDAYCGGTEVWIDKLKKGDLVSLFPVLAASTSTSLQGVRELPGGAVLPIQHSRRVSCYCTAQIRARPGDALVFNGSMLHRGHANNGYMHRFFYYASFACGADANTGADV